MFLGLQLRKQNTQATARAETRVTSGSSRRRCCGSTTRGTAGKVVVAIHGGTVVASRSWGLWEGRHRCRLRASRVVLSTRRSCRFGEQGIRMMGEW